jgi:hypothetical protein
MSYKLFPTPPTPTKAARVLCSQLASGGYYVFSLSKRWRTTPYDFVAVHTRNCNSFLVVRARRLPVQALPFCMAGSTLPAGHIIRDLKYGGAPVARIGPQIDLRRMNLRLAHFIPPREHAELNLLYPGLNLAA